MGYLDKDEMERCETILEELTNFGILPTEGKIDGFCKVIFQGVDRKRANFIIKNASAQISYRVHLERHSLLFFRLNCFPMDDINLSFEYHKWIDELHVDIRSDEFRMMEIQNWHPRERTEVTEKLTQMIIERKEERLREAVRETLSETKRTKKI